MKRTRAVRNAEPWPAHWQVITAWDVPASVQLPRNSDRHLVSRKSEVSLKGSPNQWLLFDRYVYNPANDKEWVDAFMQGHYGCFTAFRPDQIARVRARVIPKQQSKPTETVETNGAT